MSSREKAKPNLSKLDIPLLLATRQKGRENALKNPKAYIFKQKDHYLEGCTGNDITSLDSTKIETSTLRDNLLTDHSTKDKRCFNYGLTPRRKDLSSVNNNPAPNMYKFDDTPSVRVPIFRKKTVKPKKIVYDDRPYYSLAVKSHKLGFLLRKDLRNHKPTSRNALMALKEIDMDAPGPAYYQKKDIQCLSVSLYHPTVKRLHYKFLKHSIVPEKDSNEIPIKPATHIGPGYYTPYPSTLTSKFDKLLSTHGKMKPPSYLRRRRRKSTQTSRRSSRLRVTVKMTACSVRAIRDIRKTIVRRFDDFTTSPINIKFNSIIKRKVKRKTLSQGIRAPFMSTSGRFKGDPFETIATLPKVEVPNPIIDMPILRVPQEEIHSRYQNIVRPGTLPRVKKTYIPLRSPLPRSNILVFDEDFKVQSMDGGDGFFFKPLKYEQYFMPTRRQKLSTLYTAATGLGPFL